ncbi:DL-endopeptidase inhibitor IseA family protein [Paenibacillus dakarensis]|uniref:DL-endopeptidase inhibitor IseA family protein n=1 Tax=Paenibacillus dakarensis TaxID=1527293 RepID=UPI0006D54C14|nr:DL-endopeptidase inhibitor IseA family protein [Paenibacillus dakarensis]
MNLRMGKRLMFTVLIGALLTPQSLQAAKADTSAKGAQNSGSPGAVSVQKYDLEKRYTYKTDRFTISLPSSWEKKLTAQESKDAVVFYYTSSNNTLKREFLFSVEWIAKEHWGVWQKNGFFKELGRTEQVVYALHKPSESPFASAMKGADYKETQKMLKQLDTVLGFKLLDPVSPHPSKELILTDAGQAAELYLFGLQHRNASIQYAAFSKEMKKRMLKPFESLNWVTGVSSPWITGWKINKQTSVDSTHQTIEVTLNTATSAGPDKPVRLTISLALEGGKQWVVDNVKIEGALPRSGLTNNGAVSPQSFTVEDARKLALQAVSHYWYMNSGGTYKNGGAIKEFSIKGKGDHYRWMGNDLDTKAKLSAYLQEVYTKERVERFLSSQLASGNLAEKDGRLAQPNADGGSILDWANAKIELTGESKNHKTFRYIVPAGGSDKKTMNIGFSYVEGSGWRIDEDIREIR